MVKVTRLKMNCNFVKVHESGDKEISLSPVIEGSTENKEFFKFTPGGRLDFYCVNPEIQIEQGKAYYVDITPA
jgi:hypothetical protein